MLVHFGQNIRPKIWPKMAEVRPNGSEFGQKWLRFGRTVRPNLRSTWPNLRTSKIRHFDEKKLYFQSHFEKIFPFNLKNLEKNNQTWILDKVQNEFTQNSMCWSILDKILDQKFGQKWLRFGRTVRPNLRSNWPNRFGSAEPRFWLIGRSLILALMSCVP